MSFYLWRWPLQRLNVQRTGYLYSANRAAVELSPRWFSTSRPVSAAPAPQPSSGKFEKPTSNIRNFCIIAHIDHGKSTLSDRLLEVTGTISATGDNKQVLDKLKVERERGITVKAQTASMLYNHNGEEYLLNLIDTPGHVDFRSEVAASLAACDGALLVVDAAQGIQAQTVANFFLASDKNLPMIPVLNKIDLPNAEPERIAEQMEDTFAINPEEIMHVSAKKGLNVASLLPAICERIPSPGGSREKPLKTLLVDSWYDNYVGVVALVRLFDGTLSKGQQIVSAHTGRKYEVSEVGVMHPHQIPVDRLSAGQVGYVICGMKKSSEAHIGDTFYLNGKEVEPLPGFEELKSMVFVGAFPLDSDQFNKMADSIEKLALNDRSLSIQRESSTALGQGFRMGFLGYLHVGITVDRLRQEYGSEIIVTAPTVPYKIVHRDGSTEIISNPAEFPDPHEQNHLGVKLYEPMVDATMIFPSEYLGDVIELCEENRGTMLESTYVSAARCLLKYKLPLAHLVDDFFGKLKGRTRGYASLDYEDAGYETSDIVKMELLVNGDPLDALASVMHRSLAERRGRAWVKKLKPMVDRQYFEVVIQAAVGRKVIARETVQPFRKDVTAKLYGGDHTRRKKLLEKQKVGRKRMRRIGSVDIPQEAFMQFLQQGSS